MVNRAHRAAIAAIVVSSLALTACVPVETIAVDVVLPELPTDELPPDPGVVVFGTNGILDDLEEVSGIAIPRGDIVASEQQFGANVRLQFGATDSDDPTPSVAPQASGAPMVLASATTPTSRQETDYSGEGEAFMAGTLLTGMLLPSLYGTADVSGLAVGKSSNSADRFGSGAAESSGGVALTRTDNDNANVEVTQVVTSTENGVTTTVRNSVSIEGRICPADDGEFDFTAQMKNTAQAGPDAASGTVRQDLTVRVTGRLGTDGYPETLQLDGTQGTFHTPKGGRTVSVETRHRLPSANLLSGFQLASAPAEIIRSSTDSTPAQRTQLASSGAKRLAMFASGAVMGVALSMWNNGCVKIEAPAPKRVQPTSSTSIEVTTKGVVSKAEFTAPVTIALSGKESVDRTTLTTKAAFSYVAAGPGTTASIELTTESRRGKARLTITIATSPQAYFAEGGGGDTQVSGVICSLGEKFELTGGAVTLVFDPSTSEGTEGTRYYTDDGSNLGEFGELSGEGPYTVDFGADGIATSMSGTGTGKTVLNTPLGQQEFTFPLDDKFTLSPLDPAPPECSG